MEQKDFQGWIRIKESLHFRGRLPCFSEGDVWWCSIGENVGVEINGKSGRFTRPVIIMKKLGRKGFMGIPLTSQEKVGSWYVSFEFLEKIQYAAICQARVISTSRLHDKMGQIPDSDLQMIKTAFHQLFW